MMKTFSIGGIHPSDSKISKDCRIEVLPVPSKVFISVDSGRMLYYRGNKI